jgi:hypothetical protein
MITQQKGKTTFTEVEIQQIEDLLHKIRQSKRNQQLLLRKQLRAIGFYIIDYTSSSNGFTVEDFRKLIESELIRVDRYS